MKRDQDAGQQTMADTITFILGGACLVGASAALVYWRLLQMQLEIGEMVECLTQEGVDPDTAFLRAIAEIQAKERSRRRSPSRWASIKYVQWSRRNWAR